MVKFLLTAGADVAFQNFLGETALHMAVLRGHLEIVKTSLAARADVNKANSNGSTPWHIAYY